MSKAFTREDDASGPIITPRLADPLPQGARNYLTPDGARRLRAQLDSLINVERPRAAATSDPNLAREQLASVDQRIHRLEQSLQSALVVEPPIDEIDHVRFGATVRVRESSGEECNYRIVGIDETDIDRGWVSWVSPIARALLNARPGQRVRLKLPSGEEELEVLSISYQEVTT